jgi:hypothetical protein
VDEPVRLHPNLPAIYRRKVATLQNLLEDDATRSEAVEVIRSLIDQVIFRPPPTPDLRSRLNNFLRNSGLNLGPAYCRQ